MGVLLFPETLGDFRKKVVWPYSFFKPLLWKWWWGSEGVNSRKCLSGVSLVSHSFSVPLFTSPTRDSSILDPSSTLWCQGMKKRTHFNVVIIFTYSYMVKRLQIICKGWVHIPTLPQKSGVLWYLSWPSAWIGSINFEKWVMLPYLEIKDQKKGGSESALNELVSV